MAQRSESRAAAKVKRTQKNVPPKKASASAVIKSAPTPSAIAKPTSPITKNTPRPKSSGALETKTTLNNKSTKSVAADKVHRAKKPPTVAVTSRLGKVKSASPTAKVSTSATKAESVQTNKPQAAAVASRASHPGEKTKRTASPAKAPKSVTAATANATALPRVRRPTKVPAPLYLAAELGQPIDHRGEPIGAGASRAKSDTALQDYTLQLWRQMQSGRVVNRYTRAIERAGLTTDEVWTAGITDVRPTSSTSEEMRRYRQKLLFRANLLEAILSETVADLHRLDGIEPASAETARESG